MKIIYSLKRGDYTLIDDMGVIILITNKVDFIHALSKMYNIPIVNR